MVDDLRILQDSVYVLYFCKDNRLSPFVLFFRVCFLFYLFICGYLFIILNYLCKLKLEHKCEV